MHRQDPNDPTGVSDDSPAGGSGVARARDRKANAAIQLRIAGASWAEVAEALGYPTPRAALVATEKALEKELRTEENKTNMRSMAGRRLERMLRGVWAKAIDPEHPEHLLAVDKARLIIDRHAKLYGLDAPTEVVVTSPAQEELEKWVSEVIKTKSPQLDEADIFDADWYEEENGDDDEGGEPLALPAG
jgi:anti-sigma factor RsiW